MTKIWLLVKRGWETSKPVAAFSTLNEAKTHQLELERNDRTPRPFGKYVLKSIRLHNNGLD